MRVFFPIAAFFLLLNLGSGSSAFAKASSSLKVDLSDSIPPKGKNATKSEVVARVATIVQNGTAAVVGKNLITIQEARFYRALQRFREGESDIFRIEEGEELRRTVQKVVLEEMVLAELKSFQFDVSNSKNEAEKLVRERRTKSKVKGKEWKELQKTFGKSESAVIDRLQKSLQVEAFIQKKVETLTPIVTDAEAERYYQQNQSRFLGNTYDQLKPNIILLLKKERMQKGLEEWVKFLKDKYGVTNLLEG